MHYLYRMKAHMTVYLCLCRENEQMVLPVEKKMSELEMGLLHLQQNIGIPEINLVIHPIVAQVCLFMLRLILLYIQ